MSEPVPSSSSSPSPRAPWAVRARSAEPLPTDASRCHGMRCERCGAAGGPQSRLYPSPLAGCLRGAPPVLLCPDCAASREALTAPAAAPPLATDPPDAADVCDLDDPESEYALFAEAYGDGGADVSPEAEWLPRWLAWLVLIAGCAALSLASWRARRAGR